MSLTDYSDIINFDFPYIDTCRENIYACLSEPPILTVIIGAKCLDGVVLVTDKKLTNIYGGEPQFREKIFGELAHFPLAYTGLEEVFHVFRKAVVGEWTLKYLSNNPLSKEDVIPTYASTIKPINGISSKPRLEILIGKHFNKNTDLYYIKHNGEYSKVNYAAIGSGKRYANQICQSLQFDQLLMKDFAKHAYLAIMYMDQYHPELGVGVKAGDFPHIRYLNYSDEWDQDAKPEDIKEFRKFTDEKLEHYKQMLNSFTQ